MTGPPAPEQPRHIATRDGLLVLLTLTTGAVDASSFLHLGNVFSSVITGNLVLLGLSAATLNASLSLHSGVARRRSRLSVPASPASVISSSSGPGV